MRRLLEKVEIPIFLMASLLRTRYRYGFLSCPILVLVVRKHLFSLSVLFFVVIMLWFRKPTIVHIPVLFSSSK